MPLFKINWDDIIKADGAGHEYVTTTPAHPNGEVRGDRNKKYVYLHRALMELHLKRYLKPEEEVHHKDDNPGNNNISNLVVRSKEDHAQGHAKKKEFWKKSPRTKARKVAEGYLKMLSES